MISRAIGNILYISRCHNTYQRLNAPDENLLPMQMTLLSYICRKPGCVQDELSCHFGVDKTRVAKLMKDLEANGYVTKKVCQKDGRCREIFPTEKALLVYPGIHEHYEIFTDELLKGLTEEEIEELTRLTERLRENGRKLICEK